MFLEILQNSQETPVPETFFFKVEGLRPATILKRDPGTGVFAVNFAKFQRTLFLQDTSRRLVLILTDANLKNLY